MPNMSIARGPSNTITTGDDGPGYCPYALEQQHRDIFDCARKIDPKDIAPPSGPVVQSSNQGQGEIKLQGNNANRGFLA